MTDLELEQEQDGRPWVKLSVDYFRNMKVMCVSNDAKVLHLTLITYSAENRTNGVLPTPVCKQMGLKPFKELVDYGLLEPHPDGGHAIHDYGKHQSLARKIEKRTEQLRGAASIGGRKSNHVRNHVNKGIVKDGCEFCETPAPPLQSEGPIPF